MRVKGPGRGALADRWMLEPGVVFLNHGSFGACPRDVLEEQLRLRARIEAEPVRFFVRELERMLDQVRSDLGAFLRADPEGIAFVPNATTGINAVLRSLDLQPGDEILVTDHEYNATRNAVDFVCERSGARVVLVEIPFPGVDPDTVVELVLSRVGAETRYAVLDHVTSQTGLVLPIERLVAELRRRGVETLVDGAHGPGMLDLDLRRIGAAWYAGNCHKWLCAPKGAALLYTRGDKRATTRPAVISHGANADRSDRSRYLVEFDWTGTDDPTPILCIPRAIRFLGDLHPGGWEEHVARNRELVLEGREKLRRVLEVDRPCPDEMIGMLASLPLPEATNLGTDVPRTSSYTDELQDALMELFRCEVPVIPWPAPPRRLIRISAQAYNHEEHYDYLAAALQKVLRGMA